MQNLFQNGLKRYFPYHTKERRGVIGAIIFSLLFLALFQRGVGQETPVKKYTYDTIWLSPPGSVSLNGNDDPCFVLVGKMPIPDLPLIGNAPKPLPTTIAGSVTYDYQYRSLIDTPFYTKNFQQHTLSANIAILYKGVYPVNIRFQVRKSNQPLFRDFADINLGFEPRDFTHIMENRIQHLIANRPLNNRLQQLQQAADRLKAEKSRLNSFVSAPATLQRIVEARERAFKNQHLNKNTVAGMTDSVRINAEDNTVMQEYEASLARLTALKPDIKKVEDSLLGEQRIAADSLRQLQAALSSIKTKNLQALIDAYGIPEDSLPPGYKKLLALRQFSAGRSMANHSELTAKNISVTGFSIAYNPSWYAALTAGFTDYNFRDFRTNQRRLPKQYLAIGRFGWGDQDKSSIIFSYFTGRRNLLSQYGAGTNTLSSFAISGISVEGIYHPAPHQQLSIEIAKSNYPKYIAVDPNTGKPFRNNWLTAGDRQNEAYSMSYKGEFPKAQTKLEGSYKRVGAYYQSYAFYNSPGQQDAWNVQLDQRIKKWLSLRGGLQKNQYKYNMLAGGLKSNVVFKTVQATLHYKRWPVMMAGYYPASQITLVDNYIPVENRFYTLNLSANHSYSAAQVYMNTALVYTRFYNQSTDTGFLYYNAKNISFMQMAWLGKWSLQGSLTGIWQNLGRMNVAEATGSFKASEAFGLTGGVKYNTLLDVTSVWGYSVGCSILIKKLGALQAMMDKSYLPGQQHNLLPNTNGRLTFIKTF